MAKVRILTDRVANQIAAGEVIERPAAVVKELVENALDAGATRIEVEFRHGGRSLMRIEDNGHGMSRDDALLALERHATSKIVEADDLNRLASFGFRGEALPSIASVSRFELQTREAGTDVGTEILVNGGKFVHVRDCGRPVGTRIEVTHLFNSVPARRKFLKSDQTEAAHIVQGVRLYALAFPQVAFTLIEDGRVIFRSPECSGLVERIGEIFGRQVGESLVPLEVVGEGMQVSGLIGRPGLGRATRHEMITFINQRPVDSRTLNYALIESYHESLPKGRYPLAFIFLEIDPAAVDVNVHPAKREVRFRSESAVRGFVIRSVLQRLRELGVPAAPIGAPPAWNGVPAGTAPAPAVAGGGAGAGAQAFAPGSAHASVHGSPPSPPPQPQLPLSGEGRAPSAFSPPPVLRPAFTWPPASSSSSPLQAPTLAQTPSRAGAPVGAAVWPADPGAPVAHAIAAALSMPMGTLLTTTSGAPAPGAAAPTWRFLGLAHASYALFETPAGLVLLDRRAAHERVWFERLQAQFKEGVVPSQRLLLPVPLELDPIASALLLDRLEFLNSHGFEVVEFGRNFFRIEGLPTWMEPADAEAFVRELLGALRDGQLQDRNIDLVREQLARLAAARAIRLADTASEAEMHGLVAQLFACRVPLTSPGGRPTHVELSHGELARRFQR